jgi:23S rRNA pseudouridine2605 synthase
LAGLAIAMSAPRGERLQKTLAGLGLASRRQAEAWIRAGRVSVNGAVASLGTRVLATDQLQLDGRPIRRRPPGQLRVYLCHRSPGAPLRPRPADGAAGAALIERLPRAGGARYIAVSPMPEQDGGLELVSADGELAARLQRRVRSLPAEFSVRIHGELDEAQLARVRAGELDRGVLAVSACEVRGGEASNRWYLLAAQGASGKEVRQLFERQGALVSRVLRTRLGAIGLERQLARGRFRALEPAELELLLAPLTDPASAEQAARDPAPADPPRRATARRSSRR